MATGSAKYVYIPGTKIPWMTNKHGQATLKAGITARTGGMGTGQSDVEIALTAAMAKGISKCMSADTALTLDTVIKASQQGLLEGLIDLREDMENTNPTIPVLTGNLRASWFIDIKKRENIAKKYAFAAEAGFSTAGLDPDGKEYAVYVHEMIDEAYGKKINWTRPGSGPKFLEKGLIRNTPIIVNRITTSIKLITA